MVKIHSFLACLLIFISDLHAEKVSHHGCYASWDKGELTIGNTHVERRWKITESGHLVSFSFLDKEGEFQWLRRPGRQPAPHQGGLVAAHKGVPKISASFGKLNPVEADSLLVNVSGNGAHCSLRIFPDSRGVTVQYQHENSTTAETEGAPVKGPNGLENADRESKVKAWDPAIDDLVLSPIHFGVTQVELLDQTDHRNELVFEKDWLPLQDSIKFPGNLAFVESTLTRRGLVFLKLAPLPHARPQKTEWDFRFHGKDRRLTTAGHGYPSVILSYSGGRPGRIAALMDYQRCLRQYDPKRDGTFLSNTWGDRSQDARVSETFLKKEIEAGARLGVDVVQVDDGWQKGMSGNSAFGKGAWGEFYEADPNFWAPHPERFPNGLGPLVDISKANGMKFGLWFGPDSSDDMKHWERDASILLERYQKDNIHYIKIDAVEIHTKKAEGNLHRFYEKVLKESDGRVVFDADATAGIRPGYFGTLNVGPVFLENRYTDFHRYYPHHTLRNVWEMAEYVDPVRLRMEFLNVSRNREKYRNDPLAPALYPPDTLFASVMFTNPLGWFEVSNLPESYFEKIPPLVKAWKQEREAIFSGHIIPIGEAPDGLVWTGLASVSRDRLRASCVIFRETNSSADWSVEMPLMKDLDQEVRVLSGKGTAQFKDGRLTVEIPEKLQYLFLVIE